MAKVLGQSARYTSEQAVKDHVRVMLHCLIMIAFFAAVEGACLAQLVPVALLPPWIRLFALPIMAFGGVWILIKWGRKRLQTLERDRAAMRRGASGEILVGLILSDFPDEFYVINDLTTAYGNLDHVVIGPTGVFVFPPILSPAKPNANTQMIRPNKCLVVNWLASGLRAVCPSQHGIRRHHHQGSIRPAEEKPFLGYPPCFLQGSVYLILFRGPVFHWRVNVIVPATADVPEPLSMLNEPLIIFPFKVPERMI